MASVLCVVFGVLCPHGDLVRSTDLHEAMDRALANGWEPVQEADAPPNSPGYVPQLIWPRP